MLSDANMPSILSVIKLYVLLLSIVKLRVIMLSVNVIKPKPVMLSVVILGVVVPCRREIFCFISC